jgi:hypothetical protein
MEKRVVFISWSGENARVVACAVKKAVEVALPGTEPFVSEQDIAKGSKGTDVISSKLEEAFAGVICVTRENKERPWILFEAGALSNSLGARERVCPLLIDVDKFEVSEPLSLFQMTVHDKEDVLRMFRMLNASMPEIHRAAEALLAQRFDLVWPELSREITAQRSSASKSDPVAKVNTAQALVQILESVGEIRRGQIDTEEAIKVLRESAQAPKLGYHGYLRHDYVLHDTYGPGQVLGVDHVNDYVEVLFDGNLEKRIRSNYERMVLTRRDEQKPEPAPIFGSPALRPGGRRSAPVPQPPGPARPY